MKILGIDYGTKRVGVAVSDDSASFAFPKAIVPSESAIDEIMIFLEEEQAKAIVIGYSVASNGEENEVVSKVEQFKKQLLTKTEIPVYFEREDYSSVEAHRYQTTKGSRDDSAAAIILQRFLDKKGNKV